MGLDDELLREIVRRVLTVAQLGRIILFGSAATGQMNRDSDIDLLVVEAAPVNTHDRSVEIRRALGRTGYPLDVIVMATERYEGTRDIVGGIAFPAAKYGRVLLQPIHPDALPIVRQWIEKAEADLQVAEWMAAEGAHKSRIREIVGFHCQQAAEKYIKALLTRYQIEFPKLTIFRACLTLWRRLRRTRRSRYGEPIGLAPLALSFGIPAMPLNCFQARRKRRSI